MPPPAGKAVTLSLTAGDDDDDDGDNKDGGAGGSGGAAAALTLTAAQLAPCSGAECAERVGNALCGLLVGPQGLVPPDPEQRDRWEPVRPTHVRGAAEIDPWVMPLVARVAGR